MMKNLCNSSSHFQNVMLVTWIPMDHAEESTVSNFKTTTHLKHCPLCKDHDKDSILSTFSTTTHH
eukprot:14133728-Ditylum_brightwellii.AAC.1